MSWREDVMAGGWDRSVQNQPTSGSGPACNIPAIVGQNTIMATANPTRMSLEFLSVQHYTYSTRYLRGGM